MNTVDLIDLVARAGIDTIVFPASAYPKLSEANNKAASTYHVVQAALNIGYIDIGCKTLPNGDLPGTILGQDILFTDRIPEAGEISINTLVGAL